MNNIEMNIMMKIGIEYKIVIKFNNMNVLDHS